ncbi:MAG: GTPase RsgA, partial [Lachnospiraceae bacterium]|nr:GTPase RsgA [Lachnospiraceae bacterium]
MQGKIVKGIAGFYYVHIENAGIYECKARGVFRKDNRKPLVGDDVEMEVLDETEKKGNITELLTRKSELIRPAVANVDQALIIFSITKPAPSLNLLDRFLVMMERQDLPCVVCFNKQDIAGIQYPPTICGVPAIRHGNQARKHWHGQLQGEGSYIWHR